MKPEQMSQLISGRFMAYFVYVLAYYLIQLTGCVGVVNFYSDVDRFNSCGIEGYLPVDNAKVYDGALLLLAIFHLIEWIRTTLLFTVVVLGQTMQVLLYAYAFLFLNTIFGIIVVIYAMMVRFGDEGEACAD